MKSRNRLWMTLPIIVVSRLPRMVAFTKSPTAGIKVSSEPAKTPGIDRGSVTRRNDWKREAYERRRERQNYVAGARRDLGISGNCDAKAGCV